MSQDSDNRSRGVLTPTDRKFLRGKKEYDNPETTAHRKRDIRDRVRNSILDFKILLNHLDKEERDKIFSDVWGSDVELLEGLEAMIGFVCQGVEGSDLEDISDYLTAIRLNKLGDIIRGGVRAGFEETDFSVTGVDSKTNARGYSQRKIDVLKNKFAAGHADPPTSEEVELLMRAGELDRESIQEFLETELGGE